MQSGTECEAYADGAGVFAFYRGRPGVGSLFNRFGTLVACPGNVTVNAVSERGPLLLLDSGPVGLIAGRKMFRRCDG